MSNLLTLYPTRLVYKIMHIIIISNLKAMIVGKLVSG